jgi:hypothetical protein
MPQIEPLVAQATPEQWTEEQLTNTFVGAFAQMKGAFENAQMLVWNNPQGLTPQQVFDRYGTRAYGLLVLSEATRTYLNQARQFLADPGAELVSRKPEGVNLVIAEDGKVTVS